MTELVFLFKDLPPSAHNNQKTRSCIINERNKRVSQTPKHLGRKILSRKMRALRHLVWSNKCFVA